LKQLSRLALSHGKVDPTNAIRELNKLDGLFIWDMPMRRGLQSVSDLISRLNSLQVCENSHVDSADCLRHGQNLEVLWLWGCPLMDISALADLSLLRDLSLYGTHVVDVSPISSLPSLERIDVRRCLPMLDLSSLAHSLRRADVWIMRDQVAKGLDAIRQSHRVKYM
jgi:Leucine-rich repeat (LRR) protein